MSAEEQLLSIRPTDKPEGYLQTPVAFNVTRHTSRRLFVFCFFGLLTQLGTMAAVKHTPLQGTRPEAKDV